MRGIILAGGKATRLYPLTYGISKHLLPIYDKPMIYYAISTLMLAGIREILLISNPRDLEHFQFLLKDGQQWGINFFYAIQEKPEGIAQAYLIAKNFLQNQNSALILGDNFFYGHGLKNLLQNVVKEYSDAKIKSPGAYIFAYHVHKPEAYGVVAFHPDGCTPLSLEEKPRHAASPWAVTGLYFYDESAPDLVAELRPSQRGEIEITDLNNLYLQLGKLQVHTLGRGFAWLDMGSSELLLEAAEFVRVVQKRQALYIACPEEIAYQSGWISAACVEEMSQKFHNSPYGQYLQQMIHS